MPKRTDIKSICIIGAGPIIIGQACEFDYSGTQACKALREEGYRIVLINSNPATIMTDPDMADATYIEPITPEMVTKVLEKEKVDAILPTMGGQTALNTALSLSQDGTLKRLGIELIGADEDAIEKAEDRQKFRDVMDEIGLESPRSHVVHTLKDGLKALDDVGLPTIIRPSFTLGGTGGGIAYNREEFEQIVQQGLAASPVNEVLVEESVLGWKEYEMEVVRDKKDNCIIICSIENIDPMGIHTGDSVTVAPALTMTDKEYQIMRNASLAVLRGIGVETGGSNVQFALNPKDGRMVVIEMNPRVSRSSALASKATGFPIAKIAAKLAVGYTLDELQNDLTEVTPASFEPSIDYVVTKIPRFAFEKFKGSNSNLSTSMKSVGEAMAIGRNFQESLQKALRSMETGLTGLNDIQFPTRTNGEQHNDLIRGILADPKPGRILAIAQGFRDGLTLEDIQMSTSYDPWFLRQIEELVSIENHVKQNGLPQTKTALRLLKSKGFSDERLAELTQTTEDDIRQKRLDQGVLPVFKSVDTCAAEFSSETPYLYSTYEGLGGLQETISCESQITESKKVIILGGGPNRIGQGIEFDYCCVHACLALKDIGFETIMVNCNPETVSTDYDTANKLYFEPLTNEDVLSLIRREQEAGTLLGVIVQLGGQTPLKLSQTLQKEGIPILGTNPDAIDLAEDRERFKALIDSINIKQPPNGIAKSKEEVYHIIDQIGYPVVLRPSYVLGGRGMEIIHHKDSLDRYIDEAVEVSGNTPLLIDHYLQHAIEVDIDVLSDGEESYIAAIMEHIEEAGIHSGDSACALPPYSLSKDIMAKLEDYSHALAKSLNIIGLMNVQFAIKDDNIYILEVNPRASRTVPFVAKATGVPIAKIASRLMMGEKLSTFKDQLTGMPTGHVAIKETVIPFGRFPGVNVALGPEMRSTGEVMGIDKTFETAFVKSQISVDVTLPKTGTVFISVKDSDKEYARKIALTLYQSGFDLLCTDGTAAFIAEKGIPVRRVNKVMQGRPHIVDAIANDEVDMIINTTEGPREILDSFNLKGKAMVSNVPYYTTLAGAEAAVKAMVANVGEDLDVCSIQAYINTEAA
jgi:carbamoyl-phosphate synthase large subunit